MKTVTSLCLFCLALFPLRPLLADFVIVQKVDGMLQSGNMTVKIKDAKVRADVSGQMSTIIDGATGDSLTLMHAQKAYMKIPAERTKALVAQMQKLRAQPRELRSPSNSRPRVRRRRSTNMIARFSPGTRGGMNVTYWIAKDFPNFAQINAAMEKTQNAGVAAVGKGMLPGAADLPAWRSKRRCF